MQLTLPFADSDSVQLTLPFAGGADSRHEPAPRPTQLTLPFDSDNSTAQGPVQLMLPFADGTNTTLTAPQQADHQDDGKPMMYLLPPLALLGVARVMTRGAEKYSPRNWERGMAHSRLLSSLLRHVVAVMAGEDLDPETGLDHIDHAACNALMLSEYRKRGAGENDLRPTFHARR